MRAFARIAVAALAPALLAACGAAAPEAEALPTASNWTVATPYAENPLHTAAVQGSARVGDRAGPAELVVGCRAEEDEAVMTAQIGLSNTLGFDLDAFEGPEGIGETRDMLAVALENGMPALHRVSGWYDRADRFIFAFMPAPAEIRDWLGRPGRQMDIAITAPEAGGDRLTASFLLPRDPTGLEQVAQPCLARS